MRTTNPLDGVLTFLAVAEARSFTKAAKVLGISPSAASQSVRALEARIGTTLVIRSTRSLSLTPTGAAYVERASEALAILTDTTVEAMGSSTRPAGRLRLTMPRAAYDGIVAPSLASFRDTFPEIEIEIEIEGGLVDIVERGYDAGLRYGHLVVKGMASVEIYPGSQSVLAASPSYLTGRPSPTRPDDLNIHKAIVCRSRTTGLIPAWLLQSGNMACRIDPPRPIVVGELSTQIDLCVRGLGISCTPIQSIAPMLGDGRLEQVLPDWTIPLDPIHLYYPRRPRVAPALAAFARHFGAEV